jgi:hypothetical protein
MYTKKLILNRINTYVFANDRGVGLVISLASENLSAVKRIILADHILPVTAIQPPSQAPVCLLTVNSLITPSDASELSTSERGKQMLGWYFSTSHIQTLLLCLRINHGGTRTIYPTPDS